jgi:CHAD domain-containing protein
VRENSIKTTEFYYDTFDWQLHKKDLMLIKEKDIYTLIDLKNSRASGTAPLQKNKNPRFWWNFPDSNFKTKLKTITDVRAILPIIKIDFMINPLRILNKDGKTVIKILVKRGLIFNQEKRRLETFLEIFPVKGYPKEYEKFSQYLKNQGFQRDAQETYLKALEKMEIVPGKYSSKIKIVLEPEMTARQAVIFIGKQLCETIKINENGIKEDIDTEFLHDFRVAIRRTRALLAQVKYIFPDNMTNFYKDEFAQLQKKSNRLRDLDVYLLEKESYLRDLPMGLQSGLNPFFIVITKERKSEYQKFVKVFRTTRYKKLIHTWENLLNNETISKTRNSDKPIIQLAKKYIYKRYNNIKRIGEIFDHATTDEQFHKLRIECKKLRYLLEFFYSLFPSTVMSNLIKQLKLLQDNLGNYNDLSVQQQELKNYLQYINLSNKKKLTTAAAIGGLVTKFCERQQKLRSSFYNIFSQFINKPNGDRFDKIFSPSK